MKYDDASWHYDGEFPEGLPPEAGATHAGMFLAWAILNRLGGTTHTVEFPDDATSLRDRSLTPGQFLITRCDEKLTNEDLNEEGNAFAVAYYDPEAGVFLQDYERTVGAGLPSLYHVADTWENYDWLAPVLSERLRQWRAGGLPKR